METKLNTPSNSGGFFTRTRFTCLRSLALATGLLAATHSAMATETWTGTGGSTWDVGVTPNWTPGPHYNDGDAVVFDNTGVNRTITVAGSVAPLSILVNNSVGTDYVFTGGAITGSGQLTKNGSGTLMIDSVQTYTGGLTTNAGLTILCSALPNAPITNNPGSELIFGANNFNSAVTVNGSTIIYASQTLASLAIGSTGVVRDATSPANWNRMIDTQALSITPGGVLNLTNNGIVVRGGSLSLITSEIASGFNAGSWDGPGIHSSCAADEPSGLTAVGVIDNAYFGYSAFSGVSLTGNEIIAAYTLYGDANLDGAVDITDLALLDYGYNNGPALWQFGDFDYSGTIDAADYALFDYALANQSAVVACSPEFSPECVPEPGTLGLALVGALGMLSRRRRS